MSLMSKYIGKTIASTTALVVVTLFGLEAFIEFTKAFPDIGSGDFGLAKVLLYVPMLLPSNIYQLFPMAALLGCILGLGLLASHSELIVMRAAGLSFAKITGAVIKVSIVMIAIMLILGELIAPPLQYLAETNKNVAISGGQTLVTNQGVWLREGGNFVRVDRVLPNNNIEGVTRYLFNEQNQLVLASFAKSANYQNGQWLFHDIKQTSFDGGKIASQHFDEQQWGMKSRPKLLGVNIIDTDQKSLHELHSFIKYRKLSGLNTTSYEFAFWQRIFQPLATLVMVLLAVPFIFGPLRAATMGVRMLAGASIGFSFHIVNQFAGPMSMVYQTPPIIAAILPTILFALFGIVMLHRLR